MTELSESSLITKINDIDTQIALITAAISDTGGAHLVNYSIGNKSVDASQKLEQLLKAREVYQGLLNNIPSTITRNHDYTINPLTGNDDTEFIGDD